MKILVCGGRDFDCWASLDKTLSFYFEEGDILIHGNAVGADFLARVWAIHNDHDHMPFPADWKTHGRSAGFIRNREMLTVGKPGLVIAFPGGSGTENMISQSKAMKVKVVEVSRP